MAIVLWLIAFCTLVLGQSPQQNNGVIFTVDPAVTPPQLNFSIPSQWINYQLEILQVPQLLSIYIPRNVLKVLDSVFLNIGSPCTFNTNVKTGVFNDSSTVLNFVAENPGRIFVCFYHPEGEFSTLSFSPQLTLQPLTEIFLEKTLVSDIKLANLNETLYYLKPAGYSVSLHFFAQDSSEATINIGIGGSPKFSQYFFDSKSIGEFVKQTGSEDTLETIYNNNVKIEVGYPSDDVIVVITNKSWTKGSITVGISQYVLGLSSAFTWVAIYAIFMILYQIPRYLVPRNPNVKVFREKSSHNAVGLLALLVTPFLVAGIVMLFADRLVSQILLPIGAFWFLVVGYTLGYSFLIFNPKTQEITVQNYRFAVIPIGRARYRWGEHFIKTITEQVSDDDGVSTVTNVWLLKGETDARIRVLNTFLAEADVVSVNSYMSSDNNPTVVVPNQDKDHNIVVSDPAKMEHGMNVIKSNVAGV